jgi:single-stranded-DNA-specific exonuclease
MILPIVRRELSPVTLSSQLHPVIDRIYRGRQVNHTDELENGLRGLTHYKALKGIETAATLLAEAVEQNKRIVIVGDFDADGATSIAVCLLSMRLMGFNNIDYLVPNRFDFGYG